MIKIVLFLFANSLLIARAASGLPPIQTVFVIMMENKTWTQLRASPSAPYINQTLVPMSSYGDQYYNIPNLHPSLPNYLWLEAGTNFGIYDDNDPLQDHLNTTNHLATQLANAGISWKVYQEHLNPNYLSIQSSYNISSRHNPFLYFDDVTCTNDPTCAFGLSHIRPYTELEADLTNHTVARYNFIVPDDCDDMHTICGFGDAIYQGDRWLAAEVPKILSSQAFQQSGALIIAFDETDGDDARIPLLVISSLAKGAGYAGSVTYNHSSLLRTIQEIFGVGPLLGDAANAANLSDLFLPADLSTNLQITAFQQIGGGRLHLTAGGVTTNQPLILQTSTNLITWEALRTNFCPYRSYSLIVSNDIPSSVSQHFFRLAQQQP
jgi:hypothetical protein